MSSSNPRRAAAELLLRVEQEVVFADQLMDQELARGLLQGPERGLFTEIVYGVLRRQGTLDHIIGQFSKLSPDNWNRQSGYSSARVSTSCSSWTGCRFPQRSMKPSTWRRRDPRAKGFINAVLRSVDRGRGTIGTLTGSRIRQGFLPPAIPIPGGSWRSGAHILGPVEAEALRQPCRNSLPSPPGSTPSN